MELMALLPSLGPAGWLLVGAGAFIVGLSKTALPGAAGVAVGLFALAMPAKESTAALLLLLLAGDAMALWVYRRDPNVPTLLRLIPSVLLGIAVRVVFFAIADSDVVGSVIGLILLVLVAVTVWRRRRSKRAQAVGVPGAIGRSETSRLRAGLGRAAYGSLGGSPPWSPTPDAR